MLEIEDDILSEVIECRDYHKIALQFGERAWIARGKEIDVVYWDTGNGWCDIIQLIPKTCKEYKIKEIRFYKELRKAISKKYDGDNLKSYPE